MADDQIAVEVIGKTDGLSSSMNQAGSTVQSAMDRIKGAFTHVREEGLNLESFITGFAGGALGTVLVQAIEGALQAFEKLGETFEKLIENAAEFGVQTGKLANILGSTELQAAAVNQAMHGIGKTGDDYANTIVKLTIRMKTQEGAWNALGVATRNSKGELLGAQQILENGLSVMNTYKAGTDRNAFAVEFFGRTAKEAGELVHVTSGYIQEQAMYMEKLGVNTTDAEEQSVEFNTTMNTLSGIVQDLGLRIGQTLLPQLTQWGEDLKGPLSDGIKQVGDLLVALIDIIMIVVGAFGQLMSVAGGAIDAMNTAAIGLGESTHKLLTGDFAGAWKSFGDTGTKVLDGTSARIQQMGKDAQVTQEYLKQLMDPDHKPIHTTGGEGGREGEGKAYVAPPSAGSEKAAAAKQQDAMLADYKKFKGEEIQTDEQSAHAHAAIAKQQNDNDLALGKITKQQHTQNAKDISEAEYQAEKAGLEKKVQLAGQDHLAKQKALDDIKLLELKHQADILQIEGQGIEKSKGLQAKKTKDAKDAGDQRVKDAKHADDQIVKDEKKAADESANAWKGMSSSITSSFGNAIKGMIHGTMTWKEALGSIIDSVVDSFIDMGIQMLQNWISTLIEKEFATKASEATTATTTIAGAAAQAGANAFAATAAIPVTGPGLAPAAGAAAYAGAMAYEGLAFAEKGMVLDKDRLVYAHKDEQILPANIARGMTNIINDQSHRASKGGDNHLTYSPTVNAPGHKKLSQLLNEEAHTMRAWMLAQQRDGFMKPA